MTSEEYVEELRRNGVKLIKNDGSLTEIPPDFLLAYRLSTEHPDV